MAQENLRSYFDALATDNYTAAYPYWADGATDPFDVFVDWWAVDLADWEANVLGCAEVGDGVECTVDILLYTSVAARYPNTCQHSLFAITLVAGPNHFVMTDERQVQDLGC